ncbi:MAG: LLM class flavin-dependent oxidoreductase [Sphingobium sp.]
MNRKMNLVAFLMTGPAMHHHGMWRHPQTENEIFSPELYERVAQTLERGKFDMIFFADSFGLLGNYKQSYDTLVEKGGQMGLLDPVPLLAMMARATRHIGLATTVSTTFFHPYHIARTLGSLDVLTGGRVAWNMVTSSSQVEARNFGMDTIPPRMERYDRAEEVLEACLALWDSWGEGAVVMDKKAGIFADPSKVRPANYEGRFVRTAGPLTTPRSAQGHPVIMQAGSSEKGRDLGARSAEVIFSVKHESAMQDFYSDIKRRMESHGRGPDDCKILTCVDTIIGETESIAREKQAYVNSLVDAEGALALASSHAGLDLSRYPLDLPLTEVQFEEGSEGAYNQIAKFGGEGLTLREAAVQYGTHMMCPQIVGTPEQVADKLQHLFENRSCDGFVMTPIVLPGNFEEFVNMVVPILQERGLFRTEYAGETLRENLRG